MQSGYLEAEVLKTNRQWLLELMGALSRLYWHHRHPWVAEENQVRCEGQKGSRAGHEALMMCVMDEAIHRESISELALVQVGRTRLGSLR